MIINHKGDNFFYRVTKCNRICCIYLVTSPSGKKYVGQSANLIWRLYKYSKMHCKGQSKLYNSFVKHGWDNHVFEIIQECKVEELDDFEIYYMRVYDTFNTDSGLNLVSGGNRPTYSKETREKLRKAATGKKYSKETNYKKGAATRGKKLSEEVRLRMSIGKKKSQTEERRQKQKERVTGSKNPMYGKKWTQEHKDSHSKKVSGKNSGMFGKKHKEETIIKLRAAHNNMSEETKRKMSIAKKGKKLTREQRAMRAQTINRNKNKYNKCQLTLAY